MNILLIIILVITSALGVITAMAGFAGTFIVWAGILLCSVINGFENVGIGYLAFFLFLAILAEIVEYLSGVFGAKKFGATKKGIVGALLGGILGAIVFSVVFFGVGTVIGVFVGTFTGAFIGEYVSGKGIYSSGKAGIGAVIGRITAIFFKIFIILVMSAVSIMKYM
ncbi:DUF456 domain-containing protein [Elusimicrobiota bacterium]